MGGFICPEDAAPSIGTPVELLGQYGIRLAILAKTTTGPITGLLYAAQKFGTAQPHCRSPLWFIRAQQTRMSGPVTFVLGLYHIFGRKASRLGDLPLHGLYSSQSWHTEHRGLRHLYPSLRRGSEEPVRIRPAVVRPPVLARPRSHPDPIYPHASIGRLIEAFEEVLDLGVLLSVVHALAAGRPSRYQPIVGTPLCV